MDDRLLSIDVNAEITKLSMGRLRNRSQAPVALARLAARESAQRVVFHVSRKQLMIEWDTVGMDTHTLQLLEELFNFTHDEITRHLTLEELEARGKLDLMVAFGLGGSRIGLDFGPPISLRMVMEPLRRKLQVSHSNRSAGTLLSIEGADRHPQEELREIKDHLRNARFEVSLNRHSISHGFFLENDFFQLPFERGQLEGLVGIPRNSLASRLRWLVQGVLEREIWLSPVDGIVFEAVVQGQEASQLPQALVCVQQVARDCYQKALLQFEFFSDSQKKRLKQLWFHQADCGAGAEVVGTAKIFTDIHGERVSKEVVKESALGRLVRALGPNSNSNQYDLRTAVFVLDEPERGFVEQHLHLIVREPPRLAVPKQNLKQSFLDSLRKIWKGPRRLLDWLSRGRELPERFLIPGEVNFLEAMKKVIREGWYFPDGLQDVGFVSASFGNMYRKVSEGGQTKLLLRREHRKVKKMLEAFEQNPETLYASLLLMEQSDPKKRTSPNEKLRFVLKLTNNRSG